MLYIYNKLGIEKFRIRSFFNIRGLLFGLSFVSDGLEFLVGQREWSGQNIDKFVSLFRVEREGMEGDIFDCFFFYENFEVS